MDKADDEELSQDHLCIPSTRFDEQLFLDDPHISDAQNPLSRSLMYPHLPDDAHSRRTPYLFMDMELDCTDDFPPHVSNPDGLDSDCEEQVHQYHLHQSGSLLQMPVDYDERQDYDMTSTMIEFSDSDSSYDLPFAWHVQQRHRHANLNTVSGSVPHYIVHDHATNFADKVSHGNSKQLEHGSKVMTSTSSHSPSTSAFYQDSSSGTSQETEALSPVQCVGWQYNSEFTTQRPDSYGLVDDPDDLLLSDPDSCVKGVEISLEDCYDLEEFDGLAEEPRAVNNDEWEEDGMLVIDF